MDKDIKTFVRECIPCQRSKVHRHTISPLIKPTPPNARFQVLHMDIIGPYPPSQGYQHIVDRITRWPAAIFMEQAPADHCMKAFINGWVQFFGVPKRIITDQGRQFESRLFNDLNALLGTRHLRTTAYRPQANGLVERFHRTLKSSIKCLTETDWSSALPMVLLGLRATLKEDINATAAEMVYGQNLQLPGAFFDATESPTEAQLVQDLRHHCQLLRPSETAHHDQPRIFVPKSLAECDWVFLCTDSQRRPF